MTDDQGSSQKDAFAKAAEDSADLDYLPPQRDTFEIKKELRRKDCDVEIDVDAKLKCGLSRREIAQMKKAGMEKPDFVTWAEWNGPKRFSHRHMFICHLSALGYTGRDIARATNMSEQRIYDLLKFPEFRAQVKMIREVEMQAVGTAQKIRQLSSQATRVYEDILHSPNAKLSLKQKTAQDVLDRELGKPLQKIENTGSILKDFYEAVKKMSPEAIPVEGDQSQIALDGEISEGEIVQSEKKEEKKLIDADDWFSRNKV